MDASEKLNGALAEACLAWPGISERESAFALLFDADMNLLEKVPAGEGGLRTCKIMIGSVLARAREIGAASVALLHNHPSGSPWPSAMDADVTEIVRSACDAVGRKFVDHFIVAKFLDGFRLWSFERGHEF